MAGRDKNFWSSRYTELDKLVEYEWELEYPLDGFDDDGSDVEARHLGLDGLDPALQQPRDARVRVYLQKKLLPPC